MEMHNLISSHEEMKRISEDLLIRYHKKARGWAPDRIADLTENAALDWMLSLTKTLDIWHEKASAPMTDGEVILAYANIGILLESWLTLFLTVHLEDFEKDKKDKLPCSMSLKELIDFMKEHVWQDEKHQDCISWMESIREKRNAVHAFRYRDIGTNKTLKIDLEKYDQFIVDEMAAPLYKDENCDDY